MIKLDKQLFEEKADKVLPYHPLFRNFDPETLRCILANSILFKAERDQVLYNEGDVAEEKSYIIVVGKMALKNHIGAERSFETIGYVQAGDTLGEEGVYEMGVVLRKETAVAEEDTYLLELIKHDLMIVQGFLKDSGLNMDWFTLNNFMKKQWV